MTKLGNSFFSSFLTTLHFQRKFWRDSGAFKIYRRWNHLLSTAGKTTTQKFPELLCSWFTYFGWNYSVLEMYISSCGVGISTYSRWFPLRPVFQKPRIAGIGYLQQDMLFSDNFMFAHDKVFADIFVRYSFKRELFEYIIPFLLFAWEKIW